MQNIKAVGGDNGNFEAKEIKPLGGMSTQTRKKSTKIVGEKGLMRPDGKWTLTDDEWSEISPLFYRYYKLRDLIDGIIGKFATGTPWKQYSYNGCTRAEVYEVYTAIKNSKWKQIRAILAKTRPAN